MLPEDQQQWLVRQRGLQVAVLTGRGPFVLDRDGVGRTSALACQDGSALTASRWWEVFVGVNGADLERLARASNADTIGCLLRIPACCRDCYRARASRPVKVGGLIEDVHVSGEPEVSPLINPSAADFDRGLLGFLPCSYHCAAARDEAVRRASMLQDAMPVLLTELLVEGTFLHTRARGILWLEPLPSPLAGHCSLKESAAVEPSLLAAIGPRPHVTLRKGSSGTTSVTVRGGQKAGRRVRILDGDELRRLFGDLGCSRERC